MLQFGALSTTTTRVPPGTASSAISTDPSSSWVCVGDINRQVSQEKRGGGSICFQEQALWKALLSVQTETAVKD